MDWDDCKLAFHVDGSLRDIYVQDTTEADWEEFLFFARRSDYGVQYCRNHNEEPIPSTAVEVLRDREHSHTLTLHAGSPTFLCHFFMPEEIELDISPLDVTTQSSLDEVLRFMRSVGSQLHRDVILTEENQKDVVWFRYSREDKSMHFEGRSR